MRLVSLCPSITQLVFDLGQGHHLVGISKFCIHPAEQVAAIEKVGGTKDPKLDRIGELLPDLVLLNREENRREDWEVLDQAGIATLVTFPETVEGAVASVFEIGNALNASAQAQRIAEDIARARERAALTYDLFRHLRWAYLIWRKPWMSVAGNNYIHSLISEAGGTNLFGAGTTAYPSIEARDLTEGDPHLVFLSSEPFPFREKHRQELAQATGLPLERFVLVDGELLSWHGCFTAAGLDLASSLLLRALTANPPN